MSIPHHPMTRELFHALARGQGGAQAIGELAGAQYSKHLILLRGVREAARPGDRLAAGGYELLAEVQRQDPAAAEGVIRHPSVGAWALRTLRGDRAVPGAEPGGLSVVAAAAAIRAGLPAEIEVRVTGGRVMLPCIGAAAADGQTAVVRTNPAEVVSAGRRVMAVPDAPGWLELRQLRSGALNVFVDDLDPFRMPGESNLAPRLSAAQVGDWNEVLGEAWPLLDPDVAAEVAAAMRVIVPRSAKPGDHVSSSSPENFGAVAMSLPPDPYTCGATLTHEVQHLKLAALLDLVPLALPDDGRTYYAPWRQDPRPLSSLLQGAYAFHGVSGFWRRQRRMASGKVRHRADAEFARWRAGAAGAVKTLLASGRLTPMGRDFMAQAERVLDAWLQEPVDADALARASREADLHLMRWQSDNEALPSRARD
jgi:uncharacterized protein